MSASSWLWVGGLAVLLLAVLTAFYLRRQSARAAEPSSLSGGTALQIEPGPLAAEPRPARPSALFFGTNPSAPSVTIAPLTDNERFRAAKPVELGGGLAGRVGALMQAAPSVLVENAHHGRHLMEVAINGELVRAASGDGFRAFAVDAATAVSNVEYSGRRFRAWRPRPPQ